jgi:putative colanic acid biosynthesis acetyltransferase WcaF
MTTRTTDQRVDLSRFDNSAYKARVPFLKSALWFFLGSPLLTCSLLPSSAIRVALLRLFGAKIGTGVVVKPRTRVKYPWLLRISDDVWLGEDCWIDNLCLVEIGSSTCISQGAYLCTGNHDWSAPDFALRTGTITIGNMAWIGAKAIVCPGIRIEEGAVVSAGGVVSRNLPAWTIWAGNPAKFVRDRVIHSTFDETIRVGGLSHAKRPCALL